MRELLFIHLMKRRLVLALFGLLLLPLAAQAGPNPLSRVFESPVTLSFGSQSSVQIGETTYSAWMNLGTWRVHFGRSENKGRLKETAVLSGTIPFSRTPSLVRGEENTLYATFLGGSGDFPQTYFVKSEDRGDTWSAPVAVTPGTSWTRMAARGRTLYLATQIENSFLRIYRSDDAGETWRVMRENLFNDPWGVDLAIDEKDRLHLVWQSIEMKIWYARISDLEEDLEPVSLHEQAEGQLPLLRVANGSVHVAWVDFQHSNYFYTGDVFYARSGDSGRSWSPVTVLSDSHRAWPGTQAIEVDRLDPSKVLIAWTDNRRFGPSDFHFDVFLRESRKGGRAWEPERDLTSAYFPGAHLGSPGIASDGGLRVYFSESQASGLWRLWQLKR